MPNLLLYEVKWGRGMNKLHVLIFSFYREEPEIQKLLYPLHSCSLTRNWENICIDCLSSQHLKELSELLIYLEPPFELLGLAKQIILRAPGLSEQIFPIHKRSNTEEFK